MQGTDASTAQRYKQLHPDTGGRLEHRALQAWKFVLQLLSVLLAHHGDGASGEPVMSHRREGSAGAQKFMW